MTVLKLERSTSSASMMKHAEKGLTEVAGSGPPCLDNCPLAGRNSPSSLVSIRSASWALEVVIWLAVDLPSHLHDRLRPHRSVLGLHQPREFSGVTEKCIDWAHNGRCIPICLLSALVDDPPMTASSLDAACDLNCSRASSYLAIHLSCSCWTNFVMRSIPVSSQCCRKSQ